MPTLMVHTGGIGDFLLAWPSIHALSQDGPVELLGRVERLRLAMAAGVAQKAHDLDAVDFDSLFSEPSGQLRSFLSKFRRAVVWMRDDDGAIRAALEGCGVDDLRIHPGLPPDDWQEHASEYYLDCLGLDPAPAPRLEIPPSPEAHDIVIHPGSGSPKKNWPLDRFQALASRLEDAGRSVTWCLGPAEQESGAPEQWEGISAQNTLGPKSLVELAGVLRNTACYIGNDSGITHLAAATGCPTRAIFGPTNPQVWAPRGQHVRVLQADPWPSVDAVFTSV